MKYMGIPLSLPYITEETADGPFGKPWENDYPMFLPWGPAPGHQAISLVRGSLLELASFPKLLLGVPLGLLVIHP